MAARNVQDFIADALESVLNQSFEEWELIIVINDSSDDTSNIVEQYNDPRIVKIDIEMGGLSNARNEGLDIARGEFICFLDSDDRLPIDSLKERVKFLVDYPEVMFVDGPVRTFNKNYTQLLRIWTPDFKGTPDREMALLAPRCFSGITWMIRKSGLGRERFDTSWTHLEDRLFFLSIAHKGLYAFVDHFVYDIRKRPGSLMSNHKELEVAYRKFMRHVKTKQLLSKEVEMAERIAFHRMFFRAGLKRFNWISAAKHFCQLMRHKLLD